MTLISKPVIFLAFASTCADGVPSTQPDGGDATAMTTCAHSLAVIIDIHACENGIPRQSAARPHPIDAVAVRRKIALMQSPGRFHVAGRCMCRNMLGDSNRI
jgi:hypothetical protein